MTTTIIEESKITPSGSYFTASSGKTRAHVSVTKIGVQVCTLNASNRVWRGLGRHFDTIADAIAGYKSAAMKSIIEAVADVMPS